MSISTGNSRRLSGALLASLIFSFTADAGDVRGRLLEAGSGLSLDGATVSVVGTDISTQTQRGGFYQLQGLPEGEATLRFRYLGLGQVDRTVEVGPGTTTLDVRMEGQVFELDAFEVSGTIIGQARALNLQRSSATLSNVVSADAIGRFPDQNAAEALSRLPGISIERDQGEGRFVVVRGIDPNLNSVAIDGVKLASPSTGERATLLDTIPSDTLQRLEVYKSTLPSQPGDSVGGYINIKTPSAFDDDRTIGRITLQGNYSDLVDEWRGKLSGAYGTTLADGTVGLMLNASYEEREFGSDNKEADPFAMEEAEDGTSGFATGELQYREYDLVRTRTGISANLDFRPSNDARYFVRGSWNEYEDTEIRHRFIMAPDAFGTIAGDSFTGLDTEVGREMKDRTENMRIMALSAGGRNTVGDWTIDYRVSYSEAEEDTPFDFETVYLLSDLADVRFVNTQGLLPGHEQVSGPDMADAANYEFDGMELADQLVNEEDFSGAVDFRYEMENDSGLQAFQFGGLYRAKDKDSDAEIFKEDANPAAVDTLDGFVYASPRDPYRTGVPYVSPEYTGFFRENREAFAPELDEVDSRVEDFASSEDVTAVYAMAEMLFSGWELIAGVRIEDTRFETEGTGYNDDTETFFELSGDNDYTDVLPGIHLRKNLSESTVLRLSANKTIARPNFEQTWPNAVIEGTEVEVGNPDLDPLESINLDASIEYYLQPLGLLSAAVFYKDIDNFIYNQLTFGPFRGIEDAEITTFRNGDSGDILGLELAFQRQFSGLPEPFDGLGAYANLTFTDSSADVLPAEEGDAMRTLDFIKQSEVVGNLALTYEKAGFFVRLAYTYRDDYLDEVGENPEEDRYMSEHGQWDLSATYRINRNLTFFANWININDEPLHAYWGQSGRLSQFEEYGWSANFGVKWTY
jgi:TonB-dependent receptor